MTLRYPYLGEYPSDGFDPDRWLGDETESAPKFLTFGAGPRFCPGRNLAFLEAKTALAMIARNFHLELDSAAKPVKERYNFVVIPDGLRIRLRAREGTIGVPWASVLGSTSSMSGRPGNR